MKLPKTAVFFILLGLFLAAIAARVSTTDRLDSPYFTGASAVHYRIAARAADGISPRELDRGVNHPDGTIPARVYATGSETALALTMRVANYFSDADARDITRRWLVILAALCVFPLYGIARRMWNCQASGLTAAGLMAFLPPLVSATNGRTYSHDAVAALLLAVHAWALLGLLRARSQAGMIARASLAALTTFALLPAWEPAAPVLVVVAIAGVLWRTAHASTRIALGTASVVGAAVALAAAPHLTSGESFPTLTYLATRARFLFNRPEAPSMLSDWMRHVWLGRFR
jgi:hypothetical protein